MRKRAMRHTRRTRSALVALALPWAAAMLPLGLPAAPLPAAVSAPEYTAAPCCTLCPRAKDADVYITRFMRDHRLIIQGEGDWLFRSEIDLATKFTVDEATYADLARMVADFRARGTEVLLIDLPPRGLLAARHLLPRDLASYDYAAALASYRQILQRFRDIGFLVPAYDELATRSETSEYYFHRDGHWTPDGARQTAELIAGLLKGSPLYAGLRRGAFVTKRVGQQRHPGVLSIVAAQICGGSYPSEVVGGYTTTPAENYPFGDEPIPEITLAGTSYSASAAYHFMGFLQTALQADILNTSIAGGSYDGALMQYLPSESFQQHPPKLLIWEFSHPQIAVVHRTQMRRLIPLIGNGCVGREALLTNQATLASGADFVEVLFNGGDHPIEDKSRNLVVDLQFTDPAVSEIVGEAWYLDGKHELLKVRMNDFTRTNGRFVFELNREPDYAEQPLIDLRVQVVSLLAEATNVVATLCRSPG
jgi:alginate biosynthesis protein AlgX